MEIEVVGNAIFEPRIVHCDAAAIAGQLHAEERAAKCVGGREADEQIAEELRTELAAVEEADGRRREDMLPAEFRLVVMRSRNRKQARHPLVRRGGNPRRVPAELLKIGSIFMMERRGFDLAELGDAAGWTHELNPP